MKRIARLRALGLGLAGASLLAVATVGFSVWVIGTGSANSDSSSLGVNVADVSDGLVTFTSQPAWDKTNACVSGTNNDSTKMLVDNVSSPTTAYVVFGPKSGDNIGPITASGNGIADLEHLFVKFAFTLSWPSAKNIDLSMSFAGTTAITKLTNAGSSAGKKAYIVNPDGLEAETKTMFSNWDGSTAFSSATGWTVALGSPSTSDGRKSQTVTVTLAWTWGATFGNANPGLTTDNATAATYSNKLKNGADGLYDLLSGAGSITMTVAASIHS